MTTRMQLIVQKYTDMEVELKKHIDGSLLPSLEDIDVADLVYFTTITFFGVDSEAQYHSKIKELIESNAMTVSQEQFDKVAPLVIDFISWLKKL
jgi:hypothetical protein